MKLVFDSSKFGNIFRIFNRSYTFISMSSIKYSACSQLILKESTKDYMSPIPLGHPDTRLKPRSGQINIPWKESIQDLNRNKLHKGSPYIELTKERLKSWHEELRLSGLEIISPGEISANQLPKNFSLRWREELREFTICPYFLRSRAERPEITSRAPCFRRQSTQIS